MILVKVMESPSHADGCSTKEVFRLSGTLGFDNMTSVPPSTVRGIRLLPPAAA